MYNIWVAFYLCLIFSFLYILYFYIYYFMNSECKRRLLILIEDILLYFKSHNQTKDYYVQNTTITYNYWYFYLSNYPT